MKLASNGTSYPVKAQLTGVPFPLFREADPGVAGSFVGGIGWFADSTVRKAPACYSNAVGQRRNKPKERCSARPAEMTFLVVVVRFVVKRMNLRFTLLSCYLIPGEVGRHAEG